MNYVKIVSTFYDNTGKVVGTDFTYSNVDVLSPQKSPLLKSFWMMQLKASIINI